MPDDRDWQGRNIKAANCGLIESFLTFAVTPGNRLEGGNFPE